MQILEQFGKMLRMNYSCPQRQFILALQSRETCCAVSVVYKQQIYLVK